MDRIRCYMLPLRAIPVIVALIGFHAAGVSYAQHNHTMPARAPRQTRGIKPAQEGTSLQAIYSQRLPAVQAAVRRAIQHLETGHQQEALNELKQVQSSLVALQQALGRQMGPRFLNDRCPIMGTKIDPENVPAELIRAYGQGKVAFCCGGCPAQWDSFTEAQKTAKLKEVAGPPPQTLQRR